MSEMSLFRHFRTSRSTYYKRWNSDMRRSGKSRRDVRN